MRCVQCGSFKDKVLDSRMSKDGTTIRRRRECLGCTYRYTTYEQIERTELRVVKRDGTREAIHREKIIGGMIKAIPGDPKKLGPSIGHYCHKGETLVVVLTGDATEDRKALKGLESVPGPAELKALGFTKVEVYP